MNTSTIRSKKKINFAEWRRQSKFNKIGNKLSDYYYTFLKSYAVMFALEHGVLTKQEIESARKTIKKHIGRKTKLFVFVYSSYPVTKKPKQSRMGSGKGKIVNVVSHTFPGKPLFGIRQQLLANSVNSFRYYYALKKAQVKLSLNTHVRSSLL